MGPNNSSSEARMGQVWLLLCLWLQLAMTCLRPPPPPPPTAAPIAAPLVTSNSCRCGEGKVVRTRIVGGQNAQKNEYPWQVGLVSTGSSRPFCGGSLISSTTVVTAAHCKQSISRFQVVVGEHDITRGDGEQRVDVASWVSHPNYNSNNNPFTVLINCLLLPVFASSSSSCRIWDHDIAIITLAQPVEFSDSVAPVCLPASSSSNYDGATATATGWGTLSSGGSQPSILQEVDLTVLTNSQCTQSPNIYSSSQISNSMICASGPGKDSCQGDSGGPLVVHGLTTGGSQFDLVGVVSWGYGCAQSNAPGVYSRVTDQLDWVRSQMQGTTCPRG